MRPVSGNNVIDQQTKSFLQRINETEKFFTDIGQGLVNYSRKSARLRDKLDSLATTVHGDLTIGKELSINEAKQQLSFTLTHMADLRDWETQQVDGKILGEISQYDQICKAMREEVKINASIRSKEVLRRRATEQRRGSTVLRADRDFEKIIEDFEEQKNKDLKDLMMNFVKIELKVHLDAVNHLTSLYRTLQDIDPSTDAVKFKDSILEENPAVLSRGKSQSMGALNNLMHTWRLSHPKQAQSQENILDDPQEVKIPPKIILNEDTQESAEDEVSENSDDDDEEDSHTDRESLNAKKHLQVASRRQF